MNDLSTLTIDAFGILPHCCSRPLDSDWRASLAQLHRSGLGAGRSRTFAVDGFVDIVLVADFDDLVAHLQVMTLSFV